MFDENIGRLREAQSFQHQKIKVALRSEERISNRIIMNIKNNEKKSMRRVLQEELTQKKIEKETEYFWQMVERNKKQNRKIINNSRDSEEKKLFSSQGNVGIKFDSYESIPVEKSGPHADSAPPMNSFADLNDTLPDFMIANLQRMRYDVPTPIQKYAIPLALLGHDLMCSAQTVLSTISPF